MLIVDDEESIRVLLTSVLSPDYDCTSAGSAEPAVRLLAERQFNLVLSDIKLPGQSGIELCSFMRQRWPDTPVIMISGMSEIQYAISSIQKGAFDYLTKPFNLAHVSVAIARAMRYHELLVAKRIHEEGLEEAVRLRSAAALAHRRPGDRGRRAQVKQPSSRMGRDASRVGAGDFSALEDRFGYDAETEFVAGRKGLGRDTCNGDSGGPAYVDAGGARGIHPSGGSGAFPGRVLGARLHRGGAGRHRAA